MCGSGYNLFKYGSHDRRYDSGKDHARYSQHNHSESTFTYIVMLRFADGAMPIRWEIDKATWHAHEAGIGDTLYFNFPVEELMLLRD